MGFPFDTEIDENIDLEDEYIHESDLDDVEDYEEDIDYEIDFTTMKLTGNIITGFDACKQWAKLALLTPKGTFEQYDTSFGSELHNLIGHVYPREFIETETYRMVMDCLESNKSITGVEDFEVEYDGDTLYISFTLETIYGNGGMEINV